MAVCTLTVKPALEPSLLSNNFYYVTLIFISLHNAFISIKPVLSDHLYYVTIFDCSLGRSHKTVLTVFLLWKFFLHTNQFDFIWMSTLQWLYSTTLYSNHVNITQVHDTGMKKTQNCFDIFLVQWIHISSC